MTDTISTTLNYYNQNADSFIQGTVSVDFSQVQDQLIFVSWRVNIQE